MITFKANNYNHYRYRFLAWYIGTLVACGISVFYLWSSESSHQSPLIQAPILIWFVTFSFTFFMICHTEKHARYIANFGRRLLITRMDADQTYTYYVEGPGYRNIVMTRNMKTNTVRVISSQYLPIFPKLFYTHLIKDLHQFGTVSVIDISNPNSVKIQTEDNPCVVK